MSRIMKCDASPSDFGVPKEYEKDAMKFAKYYKLNEEPGFFGGLSKRLSLLYEGKCLIMDHPLYGSYRFSMNPQRNVISAVPISQPAKNHEKSCKVVSKEGICDTSCYSISSNPEGFLLWGYGEWTIEVEPAKVETIEVYSPAVVVAI